MELDILLDRKDIPEDAKKIIRENISKYEESSKELYKSQNALESLLNVFPEHCILLDTEGVIILINKAAAERIGSDSQDLIGKCIFDFFSPDVVELRKRYCREVVYSKKPLRFEDQHNEAVFDNSIYPVINKEEQVESLAIFASDITLQKKNEKFIRENEERYHRILDSIEEGYFEVDLAGNITFFNESTCKILQYSPDKLMGMNYSHFVDKETADEIFRTVNEVYRTGKHTKMVDWEIIRKDGIRRYMETSVSLIRDSDNTSRGFRGVIRDVTERKMVEFALKESEEKYRNLVERANDGITIMQDRLLKYVSPSLSRILGYRGDELTDTQFANHLHPDEMGILVDKYERRLAGEDIQHIYESKLRKKDGSFIDVEINAGLITFKGRPADLVIIRDITQRKEAEHALKETKEKYQMLVEKMEEGIVVEDSEGIITFVNPKFTETLGYRADELIGMHWSYGLAEESIVKAHEETSKRPEGISSVYEVYGKTKNGTKVPFRVSATPIILDTGEYKGTLSVITDINDLKKTENELREAKEKYQMLVEKMEEGIVVEDPEGIITFVNPKYTKILGYQPDEVIGKHWTYVVAEESRTKVGKEASKRPEGVSSVYEAYGKTKSKVKVPLRVSATPIISDAGEYKGTLSVLTDISDLKKTENELREAKERYQMLLEKMEEAVLVEDENGIIQFVNPRYAKMAGYSEEEFIGKHYSFLIAEEDVELVNLETAKRPKGISSTYECLVKKNNGDLIPVICTATPLFDDNNTYRGTLAVVTDITIQKETETLLKQAKLEEERYHAMMGHFVNNNLQKIISNVELVSMKYDHDKKFHREIHDEIISIANHTSRTIDIVNKIFEVLQSTSVIYEKQIRFLGFIKDTVNKFSDLADIINYEFNSLDITILCDKYVIEVFYELMRFFISNQSTSECPKPSISIKGYQYLKYYCISVSDNFTDPISEESGIRLTGKISDQWETKGHYIGIALASVIMQHYNGGLKIYPVTPKGNTFNVLFPLDLIEFSNTKNESIS